MPPLSDEQLLVCVHTMIDGFMDSLKKLLKQRAIPEFEDDEPAEDCEQPLQKRMNEKESAIIEVLGKADCPLKARTIATRAGLKYTDAEFRTVMARLKEAGKVCQPDPDEFRYWLVERGEPEN